LLLLGVLVLLALVTMSGVFGARDGAYRTRGMIVGAVLLVVAAGLFLSGRIR